MQLAPPSTRQKQLLFVQMHGFPAKFFTSPLEALAAARAKSPDLLISDVEMPSISGIDLAIRIKRFTRL